MIRILIILIALFGCEKHGESVQSGKLPVIPDSIVGRIGSGADMVIAADLGHSNLKPLLDRIPDELSCMRDVITHTGIVTIATGVGGDNIGYVTDAPKDATTKCAQQFATAAGVAVTPTANGFDVEIPGQPVSVTWQDNTATIAERGHPLPKGEPNPQIMTLLRKAPSDAKGLIGQYSSPSKHGIKAMNGWLEIRDAVFVVTVEFEGDAPGDAVKAANDLVAGAKEGTSQKGVTLDDKWFVVKDKGLHASVVATIPYDLSK